MQRAALAFVNLEDLAAVEVAVDDPYFAAPALGYDFHRFACAVHNFAQPRFNAGLDASPDAVTGGSVPTVPLHCQKTVRQTSTPPSLGDRGLVGDAFFYR